MDNNFNENLEFSMERNNQYGSNYNRFKLDNNTNNIRNSDRYDLPDNNTNYNYKYGNTGNTSNNGTGNIGSNLGNTMGNTGNVYNDHIDVSDNNLHDINIEENQSNLQTLIH